jgi:uncharacterized protein
MSTFTPAAAPRLLCLCLAALALGSSPGAARARSIDCAASKSAREKAVCADPALRALDAEAARRYGAALKQLSPDGQRLLREGQRRWLRYADDVCFGLPNQAGGAGCLRELYERRRKDLDAAAVRVGPFLFTRIDYFYAVADPEHGVPAHGQTAYPHIDGAVTEAARAWNSLAAPTSQAVAEGYCDGPGDVTIGFRVVSASEAAISLETTDGAYCHGAPHGQGGIVGRTWLLAPTVHPLRADDLFAAGTPWEAFLTDRCQAALQQKAPGALAEADRPKVQRVVTEPRAWALAPEGLIVTVGAGEVLAYPEGTTVVTLSWGDLRPFLKPTAPLPSKADRP